MRLSNVCTNRRVSSRRAHARQYRHTQHTLMSRLASEAACPFPVARSLPSLAARNVEWRRRGDVGDTMAGAAGRVGIVARNVDDVTGTVASMCTCIGGAVDVDAMMSTPPAGPPRGEVAPDRGDSRIERADRAEDRRERSARWAAAWVTACWSGLATTAPPRTLPPPVLPPCPGAIAPPRTAPGGQVWARLPSGADTRRLRVRAAPAAEMLRPDADVRLAEWLARRGGCVVGGRMALADTAMMRLVSSASRSPLKSAVKNLQTARAGERCEVHHHTGLVG